MPLARWALAMTRRRRRSTTRVPSHVEVVDDPDVGPCPTRHASPQSVNAASHPLRAARELTIAQTELHRHSKMPRRAHGVVLLLRSFDTGCPPSARRYRTLTRTRFLPSERRGGADDARLGASAAAVAEGVLELLRCCSAAAPLHLPRLLHSGSAQTQRITRPRESSASRDARSRFAYSAISVRVLCDLSSRTRGSRTRPAWA